MAALVEAAEKIVMAAGTTSLGKMPRNCAEALAIQLGIDIIDFPGGHNAVLTHPKAFASKLVQVFSENTSSQRR
jgi:hypothetical protein